MPVDYLYVSSRLLFFQCHMQGPTDHPVAHFRCAEARPLLQSATKERLSPALRNCDQWRVFSDLFQRVASPGLLALPQLLLEALPDEDRLLGVQF
jgi:hypothetical protein